MTNKYIPIGALVAALAISAPSVADAQHRGYGAPAHSVVIDRGGHYGRGYWNGGVWFGAAVLGGALYFNDYRYYDAPRYVAPAPVIVTVPGCPRYFVGYDRWGQEQYMISCQ